MTLQEYLEARAESDQAAQDLIDRMTGFEQRLVDRLVKEFGRLEISGGVVKSTEENLITIAQIIAEIEAAFPDPEWVDAVADYIISFDRATMRAISYYSTLTKQIDVGLLDQLKDQFQALMATFLLSGESFRQTLFLPLQGLASTIVSGEGRLADLVSAAQDIASDHRVTDGAANTVKATPIVYERSVTQKVADELGADFFLYQGRNIKTTRPWCQERAGHYWHRKEVEEWGKNASAEPWAGMVDGTDENNIFIYLGGWYGGEKSCRHVLIPVLKNAVPKSDLLRMREKALI